MGKSNQNIREMVLSGASNKEIALFLGHSLTSSERSTILDARVEWRKRRAAKREAKEASGEPANWRKECERLKAALMELELSTAKGASVPVAEVQRLAQEDAAAIKTSMLGMPNALAPQLLGMKRPEDVRAILDDWARSTLAGWSAAAHGEIAKAIARTEQKPQTKRGKK
jgi:hypothetical protein